MKRALAIACLFASASASAQPASPPADVRVDAKSLVASGLKLYAAKDYLSALAIFKDAYARFPSTKILLNIGTTLKALGRNAEAANTYQRYLDAHDAEATKRPEVEKALAELDQKLGIVEVAVKPDDAEVKFGTEDWIPAAQAARYRIAPGSLVVSARRADYSPAAKPIEVAAGGRVQVALELVPVPVAASTTTTTAAATSGPSIVASATPAEPPSRLGVFAIAHVDPQFKGVAALVGVSYVAVARLQVEAAALLGANSGAYAGARYSFLDGLARPIVAAGVPVFVSSGARVGVRAAGGIELAVHPRISVFAEVGVEHVFNPEPMIASTLFVPAIGAVGHL